MIDTEHLGEREATGCWLVCGSAPILVDPGQEISLETVLAGMERAGVRGDELAAVLITHIHLDHSGACGRLAQLYPQFDIYVHSSGARHLVDPTRLLKSAAMLYGDKLEQLWGKVLPVPGERVHALEGDELLKIGDRSIEVAYSPGHASHHVTYFDLEDGSAYTGDVAGMSLKPGDIAVPPTPPPDIDIEQWLGSLDLIEEHGPKALRLAHYGEVDDASAHLEEIRRRLIDWASIAEEYIESEAEGAGTAFKQKVRDELVREYEPADVDRYLDSDRAAANFEGLKRYLTRARSL